MKKFSKLTENRQTIYALAALAGGILCAVVTLYIILTNLGSMSGFFGKVVGILSPIIIALVLAYIIDPVAKFFENKVFKLYEFDFAADSATILRAKPSNIM